MSYSKLFEEILSKPGKFVGNISIARIKAFMDGYIHANWQNGDRDTGDLYFGFQTWVINRLDLNRTRDWPTSIVFVTNGEEEAFEMTKQLWAEYTAEATQKGSGE